MRDYEAIKRSTEQQATAREFFIESYFPIDGIGAEIGVLYGQFSERILKIARPRVLYLVDPWDHDDKFGDRLPEMLEQMYREVSARFKDEKRIEIMRMKGIEFYTWCQQNDVKLDFIYIDDGHEKETVAADLRGAWEIVKPGGVITGDDCSFSKHWKNNIEEAVIEFCFEKGITWRRFPVQGHTDQFLIRR